MKINGTDVFDFVGDNGAMIEAELDFYADEMAKLAGASLIAFNEMQRWQRLDIAARWLTKRQLTLAQSVIENERQLRNKRNG